MAKTQMLHPKAGVVKDDSQLAAEPRYTDSDQIRFVNGLPQKMGGNAAYIDSTFLGACRGAFEWADVSGVTYLIFGTHKKLYVLTGSTLTDITPIRATSSSLTDPFATTDGSLVVTVTDSSHGAAIGDYVEISGASAVGGITPDGNYEIMSVADANTYTIEHSSPATSSATGGGTVDIEYEIQIGAQHGTLGRGYGLDAYGAGTYGTARTNFVINAPRLWTFDQYGQNVLCQVYQGNLYSWSRNLSNRAAIVSNAPTNNVAMFVTDELIVVVLGAGGDRTLVQWNDRGNLTTWSVTALTTAGSRNLAGVSELRAGVKTATANLVFGDGAVWAMVFVGGEDVFGFERQTARGAGLVSPIALVEQGGVVYWMGRNNFFMWNGQIQPIPRQEEIRQFVYDNLAAADAGKCFAMPISKFGEIMFCYPTEQEIARYAKVNLRENYAWDVGSIARTFGLDAEIGDLQLMWGTDSYLYQHEYGNDDGSDALGDYIVMAPAHLKNLRGAADVFAVYPDFKSLTGSVQVSLLTRDYPQDTQTQDDLDPCTSSTDKLDAHSSGRQVGFKIASIDTGSYWRLGTLTIEYEEAGDR